MKFLGIAIRLTALALLALNVISSFGQTLPPAAATPARSTFSDAAGSNLPAQKIGPNDLLAIAVYDAPEFSRTVRVGADGKIALPMMKHPIVAAGLMPAELEVRVAEALRTEELLNEPSVIVTISEYQSRPIVVTGAVKTPVTFQAIGPVTVVDALNRAGGLAPDAGSEVLIVPAQHANPSLVRRLNAKALLSASDPSLNLLLEGGEEVRVPVAGRIFVIGNVKSTGSFPIQDQADTMVMDALTLAGGFSGPVPKEAWIIRLDDATQAKRQISIPIKDIFNRKVPDVPLIAHDILFVPSDKKAEALSALAKIVAVGASGAIMVNVAK